MHHFVNELDIVPRVLGDNFSLKWLQSLLAQACPSVAQILSMIDLQRIRFRPFGTYYLFVDGQLQTVRSADQPELLKYGLYTLFQHLGKLLTQGQLPGFVRHHALEEYQCSLQEAFRRAYELLRSKGQLSFTTMSSTSISGKSLTLRVFIISSVMQLSNDGSSGHSPRGYKPMWLLFTSQER